MVEHESRLQCFAPEAASAVQGVKVELSTADAGALRLLYTLSGDLSRLKIPPPAGPDPEGGLWQHTCFELFIATARATAYRELNFAPSGQWAAYAFRAYRERRAAPWRPAAPLIEVRQTADRLELTATLAAPSLPRGRWRLGLSAVVETLDGRLGYWALAHPSARPDFHHPESFALDWPPRPATSAPASASHW